MINLNEVIVQSFEKECKKKYTISIKDKNIIEVSFGKFAIVLYYSAYEYELQLCYNKQGKECILDRVLLDLGCKNEPIPTFRFMSNENIMKEYLCEYIALINEYFDALSNHNLK